MHALPKTVLFLTAVSTLLTHQIQAYCSRCVKIEGERAKQQAAHPEKVGYYEDQVNLNINKTLSPVIGEKTSANSSLIDGQIRTQTENFQQTYNQLLSFNANERSINKDYFEENNIPGVKQNESKTGPIDSEEKTDPYQPKPYALSVPPIAYSTIYTILKTRNFLETLNKDFTLFIPTNEAIKQLSPGILIDLNRPENEEKLASLVSNHVVAKRILKTDFTLVNNLEVKAISGKNLTLSHKNGKLYIDNIEILRIEPISENGIVYVINKVLIP